MGTNISVSLPCADGCDYRGSVGDVRLARSMWEDCVQVGIPLDSIEDGMFNWEPSDEELKRTLDATKVQIKSIFAKLEEELRGDGTFFYERECPWGTSWYQVACYLQEWEALMQTAHEFRIRGVEAHFFGA